jgi:hypothetical protein
MSNDDLNAIQAHVSPTKIDGYTKAKDDSNPKKDYYYMFSGGYYYDKNGDTLGGPTPNAGDGPAGEIKLSEETSTFSITVVDTTGKNFKIRDWNLGSTGTLSGENFSPVPGAVQSPTVTTLTITVSAVPADQHGKYKGYWVTLVNDEGSIIELDPRLYDMF